jgi:hypothetical protein
MSSTEFTKAVMVEWYGDRICDMVLSVKSSGKSGASKRTFVSVNRNTILQRAVQKKFPNLNSSPFKWNFNWRQCVNAVNRPGRYLKMVAKKNDSINSFIRELEEVNDKVKSGDFDQTAISHTISGITNAMSSTIIEKKIIQESFDNNEDMEF